MRKYIIGIVMSLFVSLVFVSPFIIGKITWLPIWIIPILWAVIGLFIAAVDFRINALLKDLKNSSGTLPAGLTPEAAKKFIDAGEYPLNENLDPVRQAALMAAIHLLYNLEETITKT